MEYFCQVAYTLWQTVGELLLPVGCVSQDMWIQIVMSTQLLCVQLFYQFYHICWETFTYLRQSVGFGSFKRKRFILFPKIEGHVIGISVLYDIITVIVIIIIIIAVVVIILHSFATAL